MIDPACVSGDFATSLFTEVENAFNGKLENLLNICDSHSDIPWLISRFALHLDKHMVEERSSIREIGFRYHSEIFNWSGNIWMGNCRFEIIPYPFNHSKYEGYDHYMQRQGYSHGDECGYLVADEQRTPAIYLELPNTSAFIDSAKWMIEHSWWFEDALEERGIENNEMIANLETVVNEFVGFMDGVCQKTLMTVSREVQERYNEL